MRPALFKFQPRDPGQLISSLIQPESPIDHLRCRWDGVRTGGKLLLRKVKTINPPAGVERGEGSRVVGGHWASRHDHHIHVAAIGPPIVGLCRTGRKHALEKSRNCTLKAKREVVDEGSRREVHC